MESSQESLVAHAPRPRGTASVVAPPSTIAAARSEQLRIAIVAPPSLRIPPFHGYGGVQRGIYDLCEVLVALGHRVTLCGPGDSKTPAQALIAPLAHPVWEDDSPYPREERDALTDRYAAEVAEALGRDHFDVINVRFDHPGLLRALVEADRAPVLFSCHNPATEKLVRVGQELEGRLSVNGHCQSHRAQYAIHGMHVVPYGMNVEACPFHARSLSGWTTEPELPALQKLWRQGRDYLAWVGRISPIKGTASAIAIAREAGLPIVIAGAPENRHRPTIDYFEREVLSVVDDDQVFYVGVADERQKLEMLGGAVASLFTTGIERPQFSEPFGRVLMESLASGTPVVGHAHGSATEILGDDVALLGSTVSELASQARAARHLDRSACRRHAEQHFSRERMGRDYVDLYRTLIDRHARLEKGDIRAEVA
jgi:glycosyltransferase involved in cell wall biosynthesis